ncbi:hypothetical protein E2C01_009238 [Portunus trituberculatus]|uniref:Uncharacterized protein n=1 Tax=Portunus trituberculatus TaxID=210409 RepID=A0A5B7D4U2_PORTR|nr:hypothetical protein [Portunus trituberculatus]
MALCLKGRLVTYEGLARQLHAIQVPVLKACLRPMVEGRNSGRVDRSPCSLTPHNTYQRVSGDGMTSARHSNSPACRDFPNFATKACFNRNVELLHLDSATVGSRNSAKCDSEDRGAGEAGMTASSEEGRNVTVILRTRRECDKEK